ncbi:MAG: hypothetical protein JWP28_662 [Phenylobacterium sp.]|uniref:translation initiation factor 2 n=1 Tax=Phenylobacterium sp. TaxID=1871053 RepID=UPI00261DD639|nr:translation initiation factor 2 [Phenylobacterium sp.]MDB5496631.1 hypothetical protein [Phenylobacterium sp.]
MRLMILAVAGLALAGCATITRGTNDTWTVNTTPTGAGVRTSNQLACDSTPCTFRMARKSEFDVTITKPGYKIWTGHITHHVAGGGGAGMAGNVLFGGLIGAGVDVSTGAMMDLVPNPLNVALESDASKAGATIAPIPSASPPQLLVSPSKVPG